MTLTTLETKLIGHCNVNLTLNDIDYENIRSFKKICSDVILGYDFPKQHNNILFPLGGEKSDFVISNDDKVCVLTSALIKSHNRSQAFRKISNQVPPIKAI